VYEAVLDPVEGSEQGGRRPVLLVSRNAINEHSPVVIVLPISRLAHFSRVYPSQIVVKPAAGTGLSKESVVMAEQIRTIAKSRLGRQLGRLPFAVMQDVNAKLKVALELP
jgi:mRNA interferase MazF